MTYINQIKKEASKARKVLLKKNVDERFCRFSSTPEVVPDRIWAPSQAMTKFQMEQALGDWAEDRVAEAINQNPGFTAVAFGDNDKTLSQDKTFGDIYRAGKVREFEFGKRSDILLFEKEANPQNDATGLTGEEAEELCAACVAALEVRSSRTSAEVFIKYCKKQKEAGKRPARMEPSFTVKVEDLAKVFRWIARNEKPVIYIQVFFDKVYALNFIEVFRFIDTKGSKLRLENPNRSGKFTIMIPISLGRCIGSVIPPNFEIVHTVHDNGRHDIFGKPSEGKVSIDLEALLEQV